MSGGSMNYLYSKLEYEADFETDTPERAAFAEHIKLVAKALHDIECVDSGDYGSGDDNEAIRACLAGGAKMRAAAEEARRVLEEIALDLANDQLAQYRQMYQVGYKPHRVKGAEDDLTAVQNSIAELKAALGKKDAT